MDRFNFYLGQIVNEDELDDIFNEMFDGLTELAADFNFVGIASEADVSEQPTPNMTVLASSPAVVYDQSGNRMSWASDQTIDCSVDESSVATAVAGAGNEKYLSIFVKFTLTDTDPRTDDLGATVYFRQVAGYEFHVAQGAEATAGAATKPALRGDEILLADVLLAYGSTAITNAMISTARTQLVYVLSGSPLAVAERSLLDVLQAMLDAINTYYTASGTLSGDLTFSGTDHFTGSVTFDNEIAADGGVKSAADVEIDDAAAEFIYTTPRTRTMMIPLTDLYPVVSGTTLGWALADQNRWLSKVNSGKLIVDLTGKIPIGSILTKVEAMVEPGDAESSPSNIQFLLEKISYDFSTPVGGSSDTTLANVRDDESASIQTISSGTLAHTVVADQRIKGYIEASSNGAATPDAVYAVRITFTDLGPKSA